MLSLKWYDLEQAIMACFTTSDDLELLAENVLESAEIDEDKIANVLVGLKELNDMRAQRVFDIFSELLKKSARPNGT